MRGWGGRAVQAKGTEGGTVPCVLAWGKPVPSTICWALEGNSPASSPARGISSHFSQLFLYLEVFVVFGEKTETDQATLNSSPQAALPLQSLLHSTCLWEAWQRPSPDHSRVRGPAFLDIFISLHTCSSSCPLAGAQFQFSLKKESAVPGRDAAAHTSWCPGLANLQGLLLVFLCSHQRD